MKTNRKGFTLIELLIVIAIIAVLATVVILSLNPAELLRQSRDSNRVSDMATLKSAVALYLADVSTPNLGSSTVCYANVATTTGAEIIQTAGTVVATSSCSAWMTTAASVVATTTRSISGAGWIPVNFSGISSGSPIGQEPVDPTSGLGNSNCAPAQPSNCATYYSYVVGSGGTTFKLAAKMESSKYANTATGGSNSGGSNVEYSDGGNDVYMFESGTNPAL